MKSNQIILILCVAAIAGIIACQNPPPDNKVEGAKEIPAPAGVAADFLLSDSVPLLYFEKSLLSGLGPIPGNSTIYFSPLLINGAGARINFSGWLKKPGAQTNNNPDIDCQVGRDTIKLPPSIYLSEFKLSNADVSKILQNQYSQFTIVVLCPVDTTIGGSRFLKWKVGLTMDEPKLMQVGTLASPVDFSIDIELNPFPPGNN